MKRYLAVAAIVVIVLIGVGAQANGPPTPTPTPTPCVVSNLGSIDCARLFPTATPEAYPAGLWPIVVRGE